MSARGFNVTGGSFVLSMNDTEKKEEDDASALANLEEVPDVNPKIVKVPPRPSKRVFKKVEDDE